MIGYIESYRMKLRVHELRVFCGALASIKRAAEYTSYDLVHVLSSCNENQFIKEIDFEGNIIVAWSKAASGFFSNPKDLRTAIDFIQGYGHSNLSGLISYIEYFENISAETLLEAERDCLSKSKIFVSFGFFIGSVISVLMS